MVLEGEVGEKYVEVSPIKSFAFSTFPLSFSYPSTFLNTAQPGYTSALSTLLVHKQ
jgi:hypothetical protein